LQLPLNDARILGADDNVTYCRKSGNVDGLLAKAKVAKGQANREGERVTQFT